MLYRFKKGFLATGDATGGSNSGSDSHLLKIILRLAAIPLYFSACSSKYLSYSFSFSCGTLLSAYIYERIVDGIFVRGGSVFA
jgi:hypothetical protein